MEQVKAERTALRPGEPERAKLPTPSDGFRFHCPVCESYRGIAFRPSPGYHILCAGCLAVLLVVKSAGQEPSGLAIRPITHADLERIASEVQRALLDAKERLLSARVHLAVSASERL